MIPNSDSDPFVSDPLAQRLEALDIALPTAVGAFGEWGISGAGGPAARGRRLRHERRFAMAATVAGVGSILAVGVYHAGTSSTATVHVPGFTVEVDASARTAARMSREQAVEVARAWLTAHPFTSRGSTRFTGFAVTGATYESGVLKVWENCGAHWFLQQPADLWVVDLSAPPQFGSAYVQASVLVDDGTAQAKYADLLSSETMPVGC